MNDQITTQPMPIGDQMVEAHKTLTADALAAQEAVKKLEEDGEVKFVQDATNVGDESKPLN